MNQLRLCAAAATLALMLSACSAAATREGEDPNVPTGAEVAAGKGNSSTHSPSHSDPPARPASNPLRPGERFRTISLPGGYRPAAANGGTDDYRCFLLDPGFAADRFITGVRFQPGNPDVVHHAILFRAPAGSLRAAKRQDSAEAGRGWTCFGGPQVPAGFSDPMEALDSAPWLAAWAPGSSEEVFGPGLGVKLPAGEQVILQVHYNLLAGTGTDRTSVRLRTVPAATDLTPLETMLLPAPVELPCPADQSGRLCRRPAALRDVADRFGRQAEATVAGLQLLCGGNPLLPIPAPVQICDRTITSPATAVASAGHMHLLGRAIRIELNPGTPDAETLLDIPVWNFDDQGARQLDSPVRLRRGDTVRVTCTHDARLRNLLPALADTEPRYVVWGEGTTDEMCLGILVVTRP